MSTLLEVRHVSKSFGGLRAVADVSLDLAEGEILGVIGPNGAGKTTFFNLISGALQPDEGQILLTGRRIDGLRPYDVARRGLARTFQVVRPFGNLSVLSNVMVGAFLRTPDRDEAEEKARRVLARVGMLELADRPAHGLTLAARKRLELARALATEPTVLLLDEAMAGLTPTESAAMVELVRSLRDDGITLLVIEHVMAAIMAISDRIAVLHHGELLAVGPPRSIASDRRVVDAYLGEEFQIAPD